MSDEGRIHGHAPRVRRRKNGKEEMELKVNEDLMMSNVVDAAISAGVGAVVSRWFQ